MLTAQQLKEVEEAMAEIERAESSRDVMVAPRQEPPEHVNHMLNVLTAIHGYAQLAESASGKSVALDAIKEIVIKETTQLKLRYC